MSSLRYAFTLLGIVILLQAMSSEGQGNFCGPEFRLGILEITNGTPERTYYVDDRNAVTGHGIWLYQETNGRWMSHGGVGVYLDVVAAANLQRGGPSLLFPDEVDICSDDIEPPDTLIWGFY